MDNRQLVLNSEISNKEALSFHTFQQNLNDKLDKIKSNHRERLKPKLDYSVLNFSKDYNDSKLTHEASKELGLPYAEPYEFKGRTLYKLKNVHWFSVMAKRKRDFGTYNPYKPFSKDWNELTLREINRCLYGYTCGSLSITGYHYFFLNYSIVEVAEEIDGQVLTYDGKPKFWKIHYDWFWSVEIAEKGISDEKYNSLCLDVRINSSCLVGKQHLSCAKSRRAGWSYLTHSMCTRDLLITDPHLKNFKRDYIIGSLKKYIEDVSDKIRKTKSYLDKETEQMFSHYYHEHNTKMHMKASYKDDNDNVIQTGGEIEGLIVSNSASGTRGGQAYKIFIEEFGVFPAGPDSIESIKPLVEPGGLVVGVLIVFGTGGEDTKDISALQEAFMKPKLYGMMSFDNSIFEDKAIDTGFFVPAPYVNRLFMDIDGNPDLEKAINYQKEQRQIKEMEEADKSSLTKFKAEYPLTPSDIFNFASMDNPYDVEKLIEAKEVVELEFKTHRNKNNKDRSQFNSEYTIGSPYFKYRLDYVSDELGRVVGVKAVKDSKGKVLMVESVPSKIEGVIPSDLYIAGIDGIDLGIAESSIGKKGSAFAMLVKKRINPFGLENSNSYVAMYIDRPQEIEEAFENCLKLSILFNCKINIERTKIRIISHFEKTDYFGNQKHRFCKSPIILNSSNITTRKRNLIGTPATRDTEQLMDSYLKKYIDAYHLNMKFLPFIEDCLQYSPSKRTKFDAVVAGGLCELYDQSLYIENIVPENPNRENTLLPRYIYKYIRGKKVKVKEEVVDGKLSTKDFKWY